MIRMKNNHQLLFGDMKLCNRCCIELKNKRTIEKRESWCKKDKTCNMDNCVTYSSNSRSFPDRELQNKGDINHAVLCI